MPDVQPGDEELSPPLRSRIGIGARPGGQRAGDGLGQHVSSRRERQHLIRCPVAEQVLDVRGEGGPQLRRGIAPRSISPPAAAAASVSGRRCASSRPATRIWHSGSPSSRRAAASGESTPATRSPGRSVSSTASTTSSRVTPAPPGPASDWRSAAISCWPVHAPPSLSSGFARGGQLPLPGDRRDDLRDRAPPGVHHGQAALRQRRRHMSATGPTGPGCAPAAPGGPRRPPPPAALTCRHRACRSPPAARARSPSPSPAAAAAVPRGHGRTPGRPARTPPPRHRRGA